MVTRTYGNTETKVSILGFGGMRFPLREEGKPDIDEERALRMVDMAYRRGVNYFDTAYLYHEGLSEGFFRRALSRYPRESYFLADKMPGWMVASVEDAERIFTDQLERTGAGYFDFYLCHALSREGFRVYEDFLLNFLLEKQRAGLIRRLGFSFHDSPKALQYIASYHKWDFAQLQINYLDWTLQKARNQYEILAGRDIPCIVMEPVRGGLLATLSPDAAAVFKKANPNVSVASWAIRFCMSLPNVLTVLSGMSSEEQVADNLATAENFVPLTDAERRVISRALTAYRKNVSIPCTGCRYCMDCPAGVEIPLNFKLFNQYSISKSLDWYRGEYVRLDSRRASQCVSCRKCVEHCPQHIDIPARMAEISALAEAKA